MMVLLTHHDLSTSTNNRMCLPRMPTVTTTESGKHQQQQHWRTVILRRARPDIQWGFTITGGQPEKLTGSDEENENTKGSVLVSKVTRESPAWSAGLRQADSLICINGQDLSNASHEEAVEAFRTAKEPIIVHVIRQPSSSESQRTSPPANGLSKFSIPPPPSKPLPQIPAVQHCMSKSTNNSSSDSTKNSPFMHKKSNKLPSPIIIDKSSSKTSPSSPNNNSISIQTDEDLPGYYYMPSTSPSANYSNVYQPLTTADKESMATSFISKVQSPTNFMGQRYSEFSLGDLASNAAEQFFQSVEEFDYEEVTLSRTTIKEKLGLTLCYSSPVEGSGSSSAGSGSSPEQPLTDVFIGEVDPQSIAFRCGRIREGDQILRINNEAVKSRDQAIRLFSGALSVRLLLARPVVFSSELDELHVEMLEELSEEHIGEEVQPDSGVSSTQSSEQEVEELAAALSRLRPNVPRMGTRVRAQLNISSNGPPVLSVSTPSNNTPTVQHPPDVASSACQTNNDFQSVHWAREWVVKRRADGSRYVTRRKRLMKERAQRLEEERAGLTTDDDMASCIGRYAPRNERKRQLRKHQQRAALAARKQNLVQLTYV